MHCLNLSKNDILLTRFNRILRDFNILAYIDKAFLQIPLKILHEESLDITRAFLQLEWFSNQKPFIKRLNFVNKGSNLKKKINISVKKVIKSLVFQVLLHCTLRNLNLNSFIQLLSASFLTLKDRYLNLDIFLNVDHIFFIITDFDYMVLRPEYLNNFYKIFNFIFFKPSVDSLVEHYKNFIRFFYIRDFWIFFFELLYCKWYWSTI